MALIFIGTTLGTALWYYKRLPANLYPVVSILAVNFLCEIVSRICIILFHNNLPSYFFFDPIQSLAVAWFIYANVIDKALKKYVKHLSILIIIVFIVFNLGFFSGDINTMVNVLGYTDAFTSVMIVAFCTLYLKDVFNQINELGKFDSWVLLLVSVICVFYAFDAINQLAILYLMNYAVSHHISVYDVLKEPYISKFSFCKQLFKLRPFVTGTNYVFYSIMLIAIGRFLFKNNTKAQSLKITNYQ